MLENASGVCFGGAFRVKKIVDYFRSLFTRLLSLRDTPHAIAGGVAIGMFWGFTPLFGLKTLLCIATAWLTRCSKLAAVIAVCLHDIVTPLWPILLRVEYEIGYWLLSNPHRLPPKISLHRMSLAEFGHWKTFVELGLPLFVGGLVIAIPCAAVAYAVTFYVAARRARRPLPPSA